MFLKTLTLKGFKSFADATTIEMEPGVTVVVGPNGSGKSNVVDAIGWVLGAQAPSAVRSQKMDDVIFAGTATRSALGRAEVSLTIDNTACLLPVDFTEVTVTRTLFRSGDSEYAINGIPCRLLDVQELLSDSGVGRQQHVIISQGQIDAVLNARAEDRRLIIEEAAGVLKFRRRKEKAERRLASTEVNLTRLHDLLREVRRQVRPLERQADAARRHGAVVSELHALRVYLAGQELGRLRTRLESGERGRREILETERSTRACLADLDTHVLASEAELSAMGGDDLGDALVRFESLREKARGLSSLLSERRRGIERDRGSSIDQGVIASLEAEAARLASELADVDAETDRLVPETELLTTAERDLTEGRARFRDEWDGFEAVAPGGRAAEARGELGALVAGAERGTREADLVRAQLTTLETRGTRQVDEATRLRATLAGAEASEGDLTERLRGAEQARVGAQADLDQAEEHRRAADADHHAWVARSEALDLALGEARARAGAERLAGIDGVIGTLLDLVEIDPGWEAAFEAAAGEAIAAVVVADAVSGRRSLEALRAGGAAGAVLPLGGTAHVPEPVPGERHAEAGGMRAHVRSARSEVTALLDRLVGGVLVVDDWPAAVDAALVDPSRIVVTRGGDRFGPSGWRLGMAAAGATGAALDEARRRADAATSVAQVAEKRVSDARARLEETRRVQTEVSRRLDLNHSVRRAAADALPRIESDQRDGATEIETLSAHLRELQERVERERARVAELRAALPRLESEESDLASRGRAAIEARRALEDQAAAVGAQRTDLDARRAGLEERRQFLRRRLDEVEQRLSRNVTERRQAEARRVEHDQRAQATDRLSALVARRLAVVDEVVAELRERRRRQSEAARDVAVRLDGLRKQRAEQERMLSEHRERLQRAEVEQAEVKLRVETAVESMRRELDVEPEVAMAVAMPELSDQVTPPARVRELERDLRLMGPINPLALEEYTALQERHEFLQSQLEDVKSTRRDLARVMRAIDAEIVSVFAAAFADVSQNFEQLFETLFPGGRGRLRLTDPDNLLDTGLEIEAKPSGKNVKKLSLLSGGERSLTALAYLFAVFRARPSPFYVMDEVEAALDDVNLHRFLDLVREFRAEAQLIIVSHQKRTMEAADSLYGVTMAPGGSSRVISERVTASI